MASADAIREGLRRAAQDREDADKKHARATADLRRWLRAARDAEGLSMSEAAELGGVSRKTAYALLDDDS